MRAIFVGSEAAAKIERETEHIEIIRGNAAALNVAHSATRVCACLEVDSAASSIGGKGDAADVVFQYLPRLAGKAIVLLRKRLATVLTHALRVHDKRGDAFWFRIGQAAQHKTIDHAEYGGVDADAERKRQNDSDGITGALMELPQSKAKSVQHARITSDLQKQFLCQINYA